MLLGLDDFKQINNLKDHTFGDLVLRQMAQNIQQMLPSKTEIFRFDGDEFAVVCPEASLEEIEELYRSIHTYANCEHEIDRISYFCSVSGGISIIGKDADNYLDLLKFAASALDASKKQGKKYLYCVFTGSFTVRIEINGIKQAASALCKRWNAGVYIGLPAACQS